MTTCANCGNQNDPGAKFCTACGAALLTAVPARPDGAAAFSPVRAGPLPVSSPPPFTPVKAGIGVPGSPPIASPAGVPVPVAVAPPPIPVAAPVPPPAPPVPPPVPVAVAPPPIPVAAPVPPPALPVPPPVPVAVAPPPIPVAMPAPPSVPAMVAPPPALKAEPPVQAKSAPVTESAVEPASALPTEFLAPAKKEDQAPSIQSVAEPSPALPTKQGPTPAPVAPAGGTRKSPVMWIVGAAAVVVLAGGYFAYSSWKAKQPSVPAPIISGQAPAPSTTAPEPVAPLPPAQSPVQDATTSGGVQGKSTRKPTKLTPVPEQKMSAAQTAQPIPQPTPEPPPVAKTPARPHVQPPVLVKRVNPKVGFWSKVAGSSGVVRLRLKLTEEGFVESVTVISGNSRLAQAARKAVLQWEYRPMLVNGKPTPTEIETEFKFSSDPE